MRSYVLNEFDIKLIFRSSNRSLDYIISDHMTGLMPYLVTDDL